MKAKKKPLDEKSAADFGADIAPRLEILKTRNRRPQGWCEGQVLAESVNKLKNKAGVL